MVKVTQCKHYIQYEQARKILCIVFAQGAKRGDGDNVQPPIFYNRINPHSCEDQNVYANSK